MHLAPLTVWDMLRTAYNCMEASRSRHADRARWLRNRTGSELPFTNVRRRLYSLETETCPRLFETLANDAPFSNELHKNVRSGRRRHHTRAQGMTHCVANCICGRRIVRNGVEGKRAQGILTAWRPLCVAWSPREHARNNALKRRCTVTRVNGLPRLFGNIH